MACEITPFDREMIDRFRPLYEDKEDAFLENIYLCNRDRVPFAQRSPGGFLPNCFYQARAAMELLEERHDRDYVLGLVFDSTFFQRNYPHLFSEPVGPSRLFDNRLSD